MHAWVLVLPGGRDGTVHSRDAKEGKEVVEPLFVEPSTGRRYSPARSPYLGVEFVWNAQNFWVCMQVGPAGQAGSALVVLLAATACT
jgi:hypothetical protein